MKAQGERRKSSVELLADAKQFFVKSSAQVLIHRQGSPERYSVTSSPRIFETVLNKLSSSLVSPSAAATTPLSPSSTLSPQLSSPDSCLATHGDLDMDSRPLSNLHGGGDDEMRSWDRQPGKIVGGFVEVNSSKVGEMFGSLRDSRQRTLHRSLPNLFECSRDGGGQELVKQRLTEVRTPAPLITFGVSSSRKNGYAAAMEVDLEDAGKCEERCSKPLARKEHSFSDDDTESCSTNVSSHFLMTPAKSPRRSATLTSKRLKTTDCSSFSVAHGSSGSVSSAGELERFFDSMGLDEATGGNPPSHPQSRSQSRSLHLQVSDDAMESEEEPLESISVVGGAGKDVAIIPSVETDDDEPETGSCKVSPAILSNKASKGSESVPRNPETIVLRNARILKWLVNCRAATDK